MQIGTDVNKESIDALHKLIEMTFKVGFDTHMEQDTIQAALKLVGRVGQINSTVNISHSNFTNGEKMDESGACIDMKSPPGDEL